MRAFRFHIPKKELDKYLDPTCILCGRKRSEINKWVDFQGRKALGGITILEISGRPQPVCDSCFNQMKK